jgi:hypothetical protein
MLRYAVSGVSIPFDRIPEVGTSKEIDDEAMSSWAALGVFELAPELEALLPCVAEIPER